MSPASDDWRRMGQEKYLRGVPLTWKRFQALRANWEHEQCEFCFQKFLDANYSDRHRQALEDEPEKHEPAGYTNLEADNRPAGSWWICKRCFADFADEFEWVIVASDPDGWPYEGPEPNPRPRPPTSGRRTEGSTGSACNGV